MTGARRPTPDPSPFGDLVRVRGTDKGEPFEADVVFGRRYVIKAYPPLEWTVGYKRDQLRSAFAERGWKAVIVNPSPETRARATRKTG